MRRRATIALYGALVLVFVCAGPSGARRTVPASVGTFSGTIHYTRTATLHTSTTDASETVSFDVTYDNGTPSGTAQIDFKRTDSFCGGTLTHEAHGTGTQPAVVTFQSTSGTTYNLVVGALGVKVNHSQDEIVASCKAQTRADTPTWDIQTNSVNGLSGNPDTDATLGGTVTRDQAHGCHGVVAASTAYTSCQETLTWDLFRCDPSLARKVHAEFNQADVLAGQADTKLFAEEKKWDHWLADEEFEFGGLGSAKLVMVKSLKLFEGLEKTKAVVHFVEYRIGPVLTAYWLAHDVEPHLLDHDLALQEVRNTTRDAERAYAKASNDFEQDIAQSPACKKAAAQDAAKADLADKKRALIESWDQNENGTLYWSPTRKEWEEEQAALKEAERILTSPRRLQGQAPGARAVRVTKEQLQQALPLVTKAIRLNETALAHEKRSSALTARFAKDLRALLRSG